MRRRGASVLEVRADAVRDFNEALDEQMKDTVWSTGCKSWYLDDTGRNATLWPDWTFAFRRRAARFEAADYELGTGAPARAPVTAST